MIATYKKDFAVAEVLTEAGADMNLRDERLNSPFLYAGADTKIKNRYGGIAIIPASEQGYVEIVRELLERTDTNEDHVNKLGWTALFEAIIVNNGNKR